jgi:hypothetical protein
MGERRREDERMTPKLVLADGGTNAEFDGEGVALDRRAKDRAAFLVETTDLGYGEALIVAYSELGFSASGIGKREPVGLTEATVDARLDDIAERYGPEAARVQPRGGVSTPIATPRDKEVRDA